MTLTPEQIETAIETLGNCVGAAQGAVERMADRLEELEDHRVFAVDREYDRQARWHQTYNAVRGGMEAATVETLPVDQAHEYAAEAADRAHGPLEAPKVESPSAPERRPGFSMVWVAEHYPDVSALVKAARLNAASDFNDSYDKQALIAALKPFEQEVGRGQG